MSHRQFHQENIVILCEGTRTEYQYFCSIKNYLIKIDQKRFSEFKVVPVEEEMARPSGKRKKRRLNKPTDNLNLDICYYCLQEDTPELYEKYKAYPTRFVREAKLYMERMKYQTGWVVYDHDDHPDRENAAKFAETWGVKVAFSARCFEEWLLMHFERNDTVFTTSVCKTADGNDCKCGTGVPDDCHGTICIGGRIREKKYIPNYDKNNVVSLFETYTLPRLDLCLVNAAWLNRLENPLPYYKRTRYTNVGELVSYLLDKTDRVEWTDFDSLISFRGTHLKLTLLNEVPILENVGNTACIIKGLLSYYDNDFHILSIATNEKLLTPGQQVECYPPPSATTMVCLTDGFRKIILGLET